MKRFTIPVLFLICSSVFAQSKDSVLFKFKHNKGDSASYICTVEEDVYLNRRKSHHAQIVNRISSNVASNSEEGEGFIYATYLTTENSVSNNTGTLRLKEEATSSVFLRKPNGELIISDDIYMPTVRNVPVFPDKPVKKGESWTAQGKEVQDVRETFHMNKALIFPFDANYVYKYDVTEDGKLLNYIEVSYNSSYKTSEEERESGCTLYSSTVKSKQYLYWDNEKGLLDHYREEFYIEIIDVDGNSYIFTGTGEAKVTEYKSVNNETNLKKVQNAIDKLNLKNITVKKGEKGLTISLDNIQFLPDSDVLLYDEKIKLNQLAEILNAYSNDLLITGHCAARGTVQSRQELSEQRAETVAKYLIELGVRDSYHIFTQGKGSTQPVATNATEEGRALNRRVEITIMD